VRFCFLSDELMATKELFSGLLQNNDKLPVINRFGRHTGELIPNVDDLIEDLSELRQLLDDLGETSPNEIDCSVDTGASTDAARTLSTSLQRNVSAILSRHQRAYESLERATRWPHSEALPTVLENVRKEYLSMKADIRVAYKQRGNVLCARDWQSPIYASSVFLGANRLSDGIAEHAWDYKRDGHLDALGYEEQFVSQYVAHLGGKRAKAYLTNSGMGAFTTVLHWLAHELQMGGVTVGLKPMYFENLHLAQAFFPNMIQLDTPSSGELLSCLRSKQPSVVFCDVVSNCGEVVSHDIETILNWATTEMKEPVAVVIDTTCLPTLLLPSGLLENMPAHVSVIFVESLAKFHQFGMDTVTGGVVVLEAEQSLHDNYKKNRARLGINIADASVGSLPLPNRELLTKRLYRHSRNTRVLAQHLDLIAREGKGIVESVSWQSEGPQSASWYRSSCLSIRLHKPFKSVKRYQEFEQKVMDLCVQAGLPLALGTSFGFDVSRFYVTAPSTPFEDPFLRVSVGTETSSQIQQLCDILGAVNRDLTRLWGYTPRADDRVRSERFSLQPAKLKEVVRTARKADLKAVPSAGARVAESVYIGQDALKNYLHPANYASTPLVELPADLNPFLADGVRLLAKMVPLVPLMNIKSIPAYSMLSMAADRGDLNGVEKIIESSSSNTVLSLSVIAKLFGVDTTCAIVDHNIAPSLSRMLRLFGIEIFTHPAAGHELFGKLRPRSERATRQGQEPGWLNPGQYSNPDNPTGFAQWLAPDLWEQTKGRLDVLACGLGTCGTMVGLSRGLREKNPELHVVACYPRAGEAVPGPRERSLLADVSFPWQEAANSFIDLPAQESFAASISLLRRGILGGPSSGMNYAGMLKFLEQEKAAGRLAQKVAAGGGELWCTFICCDSPLPHVDEYYDALGDDYFPVVHPVPESD
jgi:cysteine synthase/cystathionine beta-lyase/cystathionine gamma-synthase